MPEMPSVTERRTRSWRRDQRCQELGFTDYRGYLQSARWADVRRRYRASGLPQDCGLCGESEALQFHHLTYERVCEEELADLVPLCDRCHELVHVLERRGDIRLDLAGLVDAKRAERYRAEQADRLGDTSTKGRAEGDLAQTRHEIKRLEQRIAGMHGNSKARRAAVRQLRSKRRSIELQRELIRS